MGRLGDSFHRVSGDYDRGRPRYPPAAVAAMLEGLPEAPEVVDIGAGTGQLAEALLAAGARVVAVEPGAETRALLEQRLGGRGRVLDARAEELPLGDGSADLIVCADSFHWLDPARASAEFGRVLRSGGRLCLSSLMPSWTEEQSGGWAAETGAIIAPLWKRSGHPLYESNFALPAVPPDSGFEEAGTREVPFLLQTDRDGLLALFGSWSPVAWLADDERAEVRARLAEVLDRHGVGDLELSYTARLRFYAVS